MRFSSVFTATALAGSALAADHTVSVGKEGKLVFVPNVIEAAQGDTVTFKFWPKNHSIAQGPFTGPCTPSDGGFWSGYVPTTNDTAAATTTFMYTVQNASAPVWFYCTQAKHCQGGMVGVINPPKQGNRTIDAYKAAAANASANVEPTSKATDNPGNGMLMSNGQMNDTKGNSAAGMNANNGMVFASFMGLVTYLLL